MTWNMPEGCNENDIPENEELAPNQIEEIEILNKALILYKKCVKEIDDLIPTSFMNFDFLSISDILEDLHYNDGDIEDYISEPITEYQEEE